MSSLKNLLNPEESRRKLVQAVLNEELNEPTGMGSAVTPDYSENPAAEIVGASIRPDHEYHPNCPDTLACLPDTEGRPQHTLPVILRCAILGSPKKRLTIREIYAAMEAKYPYYRTAGSTWKQSVRHHLSLNRLFERQPRPVTDPGFGSYWTVNLSAPPGTKRPRKRGRPNKETASAPAPAKKKGRPRKADLDRATPFSMHEDDDERAAIEKEVDFGQGSDDECESEEDLDYPLVQESPSSLSSLIHSKTHLPISLPPFSSLRESPSSIIDRMQFEVTTLRRQSAEAVSVSLRLSEQLAQAQAEASRTRAALRTAELMLEEESRKRRDAERLLDEEAEKRRLAEKLADQESRRRREVEDALRSITIDHAKRKLV
ncbi:hypothetical protein M378DRAFT_6232 [Amanita muscaria Koide BX008]|uniref:Fork-head domain-containing protein n=1 Tax=Amanita muscaria (strain Koide BX008) TaxID=946122 RepID=A0A0C2XPJ5_AMAMK|nr:hypothetical protein M378DRAFT_6232 [Amanita muscaria Koide BX008]